MRHLSFKKWILLPLVFISGIFFMFGSADRRSTDADIYWENAMRKERENTINNFSPLKKLEYDKLVQEREQLHVEIDNNRKELDEIPYWPFDPDVTLPNEHDQRIEFNKPYNQKKEEIAIKEDALQRKISKINKKIDKMVEEEEKSCFPKDTKIVMHDGSLKPIHEITKGDKVLIYDIGNDEITHSTVNKNYIDTNNHMYVLNDSIHATAYERFLTQDGWKRMNLLRLTDTIFNGNSFVPINSITKIKKNSKVYNLNINTTHNFFVTYKNDDEWFLVHNSSGHGGGSNDGGGK